MTADTIDKNTNDLDDLIESLDRAFDSSIDDDGFDEETFLDTYGSEEWCERQRQLLDEDDTMLRNFDAMSVEEFDKSQPQSFNTILGIIGWLGVCDRMQERRHG